MEQAIHFLHLTDLHISSPAADDTHLLSDTASTLEKVKEMIGRIDPQPQFIAISGDLTNNGSDSSFIALKQHLADLEIPVFLALGNHDRRETFYQVFHGQASTAPYYYAQQVGPLRVLVLDSSTPNRVDGSLEEEQFTWLADQLERYADQPKVVIIHHPPCPIQFSIFDHITFDRSDADRLGQMLQGQNVLGVFSGHVHFDRFSLWNGLPCVIGTGLHNLTDVLENNGIRATRGGSFNLCRLEGNHLSVTTVALPSDQAELHHVSMEVLRKYMDQLAANNS